MFAAYCRLVRSRLVAAVRAMPPPSTYPHPVAHCDICMTAACIGNIGLGKRQMEAAAVEQEIATMSGKGLRLRYDISPSETMLRTPPGLRRTPYCHGCIGQRRTNGRIIGRPMQTARSPRGADDNRTAL